MELNRGYEVKYTFNNNYNFFFISLIKNLFLHTGVQIIELNFVYQEQLNSHISQNDLVFGRVNHLKRNFEHFYQMKNLLMEL